MEIAKEDLQYIRQYIAEKHGQELTPQEVLDVLNEVENVGVTDEEGLVAELRRLRREK